MYHLSFYVNVFAGHGLKCVDIYKKISGVHQGSLLGPLSFSLTLHTVRTNDMCVCGLFSYLKVKTEYSEMATLHSSLFN